MNTDGRWVHADRAGHPWVSGFFPDDEQLAEFNAGEPNRDQGRWMGHLIELMGETGGYTRSEAIDAIAAEGTLPDVLTYNPSKPAGYPNGRTLRLVVAELPAVTFVMTTLRTFWSFWRSTPSPA